MKNTPFDPTDFFNYLFNGIVSVLLIDVLFLNQFLIGGQNTKDLTSSIFILGLAYILGQIASSLASATFENILVRRMLGVPAGYLLRLWPEHGFRRHLAKLPWRYTQPLTDDEITRVEAHMGSGSFITLRPRDMFGKLYGQFLVSGADDDRLKAFRNQYLFARNLAFVLLFWAVVLVVLKSSGFGGVEIGAENLKTLDPYVLAGVCLALCLVMIPRYLKFLRLFQMEVVVWAANQPPKEEPTKSKRPALRTAAKDKSR